MVDGNIFGERTTSIATVVGIVGISLISTFTTRLTLKNTTKSPEKIITSAKSGNRDYFFMIHCKRWNSSPDCISRHSGSMEKIQRQKVGLSSIG
jgi:hypothetical protein